MSKTSKVGTPTQKILLVRVKNTRRKITSVGKRLERQWRPGTTASTSSHPTESFTFDRRGLTGPDRSLDDLRAEVRAFVCENRTAFNYLAEH